MANQRLNRLLRREPQVDEAEVEFLQARVRARLQQRRPDDEASIGTGAGPDGSVAESAITADPMAPPTADDALRASVRLTTQASPTDVVGAMGESDRSNASVDVDGARQPMPLPPEGGSAPDPEGTPPDHRTPTSSDADLPSIGTAAELDAQIDRLLAATAAARPGADGPSATIEAQATGAAGPASPITPSSAPAAGEADGGNGSALSRLATSKPDTRPWTVPAEARPTPPPRPNPTAGQAASVTAAPASVATEPDVQIPARPTAHGPEHAAPADAPTSSALVPVQATIAISALEMPATTNARTKRTASSKNLTTPDAIEASSTAEVPTSSQTALTGPAVPAPTPIDPPPRLTQAIVVAVAPSPSKEPGPRRSLVVAEQPSVVADERPSVPVAPYCPYCALLLDPPPEVNRRCPRCRERIVVKRVAGRVVYLTEASVAVFHAERRRLAYSGRWNRELRRWLKAAKAVDAPSDRIARLETALISEEVVASARTLYIATVERSFRNAKREHRWEDASRIMREHAQSLSRISGGPIPPPEEALRAHREAASAALRGIGELAREAELVSGRCCEACRADDGKTFRIALELRAGRLPHAGCPKGLCRCDWYLAVRDQSLVRKQLRRRARADASMRPGAVD